MLSLAYVKNVRFKLRNFQEVVAFKRFMTFMPVLRII